MAAEAPSRGIAAHYEVVRTATECYAAELRGALASMRPLSQRAVLGLISALEAALAKGERLSAEDVPFGVDVVSQAGMLGGEIDLLKNQFTVGSGAPDAPVIAIGTEEGYDPAVRGLDLPLWNCTNGLLWLSGSPLPVVRRLARGIPEAVQRAGIDSRNAVSYAPGQKQSRLPTTAGLITDIQFGGLSFLGLSVEDGPHGASSPGFWM